MIYTLDTLDQFRKGFFDILDTTQNIVITAHYSPDDDSIGSVLSLYTILVAKYENKNIRIVYTGTPVDRYKIFKNFDKIEFVPDVADFLQDTETLICCDASQYQRFTMYPEKLKEIKNTLTFDHHASVPDEFTHALVVPEYSSNSELIYKALDGYYTLDKDLAELFLLGILGDTGNLAYIDPKQSQVFDVVKHLIEVGEIKIDAFRARYGGIPKNIISLLQEYAKNTTFVDIPEWPSVQYSFVSREFFEKNFFSDEDVSAASHIYLGQYLPRVQGQSWGFVFSPRTDGGVRMSLRSLPGSVNVRLLSEALGLGSGHNRASGANFKSIDGTPIQVEDCIEKVLDYMKNNKPVLS